MKTVPPFSSFCKKENFVKKKKCNKEIEIQGFPSGSVIKNLPANVGDISSVPSPGRSYVPPDLTNPVHHNY